MVPNAVKYRPIVKRHGGKSYLARRIIGLLPDHDLYVEPYYGGGSVHLNKPRSRLEVINDLDDDLMNVYRRVAEDPEGFADSLPLPEPEEIAYRSLFRRSLSSLAELRFCADVYGMALARPDEMAVLYLICHRLSRGGMGKDLAWADRRRGKRHAEGATWDLVSSWRSFREMLPALGQRLQGVEMYNQPALTLLSALDLSRHGRSALVYLDPPYYPETRTAKKVYEHEMSKEDHWALLDWCNGAPCHVAISGYANIPYDTALSEWRRVEFDMPNHSGQGRTKQRRVECLWMNY